MNGDLTVQNDIRLSDEDKIRITNQVKEWEIEDSIRKKYVSVRLMNYSNGQTYMVDIMNLFKSMGYEVGTPKTTFAQQVERGITLYPIDGELYLQINMLDP